MGCVVVLAVLVVVLLAITVVVGVPPRLPGSLVSIKSLIFSPGVCVVGATVVVLGVTVIVVSAFRADVCDASTFLAIRSYFLLLPRVISFVQDFLNERYGCLVLLWLCEPFVIAFDLLCLRRSISERTSDTN